MALTLWQRLRVVFRGWSRRREEAARKREAEFLARNTPWATPPSVAPFDFAQGRLRADEGPSVDMDGLQVAYLDESGLIQYYLDVQTGEVVEDRGGCSLPDTRYKRVPQRSPESDAEDRRAFAATVEDARMRQTLLGAIDAQEFRRLLATDRGVERAWYNFKNDRATKAIEQWLSKTIPRGDAGSPEAPRRP
jgi:hypothetical protein